MHFLLLLIVEDINQLDDVLVMQSFEKFYLPAKQVTEKKGSRFDFNMNKNSNLKMQYAFHNDTHFFTIRRFAQT